MIVGTKVLAAAHLALNQAGEGSSPSGPTRGVHWWSKRQDTALVKRRRGFDPHPVLFRLWQFGDGRSAHDVMAAYRLAMANVRVRLSLGTSSGCGKVG